MSPINMANVPIIDGKPKYDVKTTFQLGSLKFHPPFQYKPAYIMLLTMFAGSPVQVQMLGVFGANLKAYLAEGIENTGPKGSEVLISATLDGKLNVMVQNPNARPPITQ